MNSNYIIKFKILLTLICCTISLHGMEQEAKRLKIDKVELVRQKGLRWYLISRICKDDQPVFAEHIVDKIMDHAKPTLVKEEKEKLLSLFATFFIPIHTFDSSIPIIFSSDSQKLITLYRDETVIWDFNTSEGIKYRLRGRPVYSFDRKKIALLSHRCLEVQIGNSLQDFYTNFSEMIPISSLVFSPDNKLLACGLYDNSIVIRDLEKNSRIVFGDVHPQVEGIYTHPICSLVFSPDGTQLASTSKYGLLLWNIKDGICRTLLGSQDSIGSSVAQTLVVRPQTKQLGKQVEKQLVSGSLDGTLRFWNFETGECIQSFHNVNEDHTSENFINSIAFTSDGMQMIVGSAQELTLWDLRTGITTILNASGTFDQGSIGYITVSPDDNYVATMSGNGISRVRDMRSFNKFSKKVENKAFTMEEFTLFKKFATSSLSLDDNQDLKIQEIMESCAE